MQGHGRVAPARQGTAFANGARNRDWVRQHDGVVRVNQGQRQRVSRDGGQTMIEQHVLYAIIVVLICAWVVSLGMENE